METQLVPQMEALPPAPGVAVNPQMVESMKKMHDTKVRGLLNSIHMLKQQLLVAKAASREHRRSKLIQALKEHIKDNDKVIDVLREALIDRGLEEQQVNDLVIKKTLTGPARFRPKTREEYAKECVDLTTENRKLSKKLDRAKAILKSKAAFGAAPASQLGPALVIPAGATTADMSVIEAPGSTLASLVSPQDEEMAIENGQRVSDLQEEVAELRTALAGKQRVMAEQAREMERLQQGEREARRAAERSDAQRHKYKELKDAYRDQHSRFTLAMTEKESLSSQLRAKTEELRVTQDTAEVSIKAKEDECLKRMGDLKDAIEREGELQQELEAERRMGASEKMRFKNDLQQRVTAEKKLQDGLSAATEERDGLRAQMAELQKEASKKGQVETELSNAMANLRDSNRQKGETRKELEELRGKHEHTKQVCTEFEARYNESKEHFDNLTREADRLKDDLKKKSEELAEEKERVADGKSELKSKELQAKQLADQIKLDAQKKEMEHAQRANERDSKLKEEKEQALAELKQARQDHKTAKADLEKKLQAAETAHEAAAAKARELEQRGQTAMKSEEDLQSSVGELLAEKDTLESRLAAAEKAAAEKEREVDTLKGEVEASEKKITELTARCVEYETRANKYADSLHVMTMNQSQQMAGTTPMGTTPSAVETPTSGGAAPSRSDIEEREMQREGEVGSAAPSRPEAGRNGEDEEDEDDDADEDEGKDEGEDGAGGQDIENEQQEDTKAPSPSGAAKVSTPHSPVAAAQENPEEQGVAPNEGDQENDENDMSQSSSDISDLPFANEGDEENDENGVEENVSKASFDISDAANEGDDQDAGAKTAESNAGRKERGQNQDDENLSASSEISDVMHLQNANAPSNVPTVADGEEEGGEATSGSDQAPKSPSQPTAASEQAKIKFEGHPEAKENGTRFEPVSEITRSEKEEEEDDEEGSHSDASSSLSDMDAWLGDGNEVDGNDEVAGRKKLETATKNET